VEAAAHDDRVLGLQLLLGQGGGDRPPHVGLAGDRAVALHAVARGRRAHGGAEVGEVAAKLVGVRVASADLEEGVPALGPRAVARGLGEVL
jgi:hypothetical protein